MSEMTSKPQQSFAVLGIFDTPNALMQAIPRARAAKLGTVEAYTPYPIHGIDEALGLRRSPLGGMVLVMGVLGALTALGTAYQVVRNDRAEIIARIDAQERAAADLGRKLEVEQVVLAEIRTQLARIDARVAEVQVTLMRGNRP